MAELMVPTSAPTLDHAGVEAARLVRAGRERLVSGQPAVTYAMLADARGQSEAAARQSVRRARLSGRLVTVDWEGVTLVPSFQFDEAYEPVVGVGDAVARLVGIGLSGWAVWRWFTTVNPWLGERPLMLIRTGDFERLQAVVDAFVADGGE